MPGTAASANQVVLLVVDGLGFEQLTARAALAPTLSGADGADRPITSVAPSTTACALTSLTTGCPPARHGLLGYRLAAADDQVLNVLRWTLGRAEPRDARRLVPPRTVQPCTPFPGAAGPVPVVSREGFGSTGFTAAHLGDAPLTPYAVTSTIAVEVRRLLAAGHRLTYVYYDGLDKVAHAYGLGEHFDAELAAVDRLVAELAGVIPRRAALVVTADHGQVDVGPAVEVLGPDVMDGVRLLSGEGRFRWLHTVPGAADDVARAARERYGDRAWVVTRRAAVEDGWFGGVPEPDVAARLGDVALVPHDSIAFLDPADTGESRLASRHGSLTPAEMLVPLLALDGGGNIRA
jgi:predicted AlkP superfamily pyrophosphatase or phosphodiesterase